MWLLSRKGEKMQGKEAHREYLTAEHAEMVYGFAIREELQDFLCEPCGLLRSGREKKVAHTEA